MQAFTQRFQLNKVIGSGSQALIKSAFDRDKKISVALKIFDKKEMSAQSLEAAYQEKKFMSMVDHPNLTKCHASFEDEKSFVIITEMMSCDMRTLTDNLNNKPIKEEYTRKIFYQMLLSVNHIH